MLESAEQLQAAPAHERLALWGVVVILAVLALVGLAFWGVWGVATVGALSDTGALYIFICH